MRKTTGNDFTIGDIKKHILGFAVPMVIGLFLTMGYTIINTIWIGNLLGKEAMAASSVSFPIIFILISIASGSTSAVSILISRNYGAKDFKAINKIIETSFSMFSIVAIVLIGLAFIFKNELLILMGTPSEIFNMASSYLEILLFATFINYMYYVINSILSGVGDTKTPVIFLILSTLINAILDPVFIMKFGLNGAAMASLISGFFAILIAIIYLKRKKFEIDMLPKRFNLDKRIIEEIFKIGMPSTIQQCLMPISLIFITSFISRFGADAIAAYGAASKVDYLAIMPCMAVGTAASVITSQNIGGNKLERIKEVFKWGAIIIFSTVALISVLIEIFPKEILLVFARDFEVLDIGSSYLRINAIGYLVFSISFITSGIINGSGKTTITMIISAVSLLIIRIPLSDFMSQSSMGLEGIWYAILITYIFTSICGILYYLSGKYKENLFKDKERVYS
ncbi:MULTISPECIES: MATE family efflux transporter [unclassified Clostridium]|uniref:MATE family efflux transporter n=1 Tax=unclassified Clostridium TaxID=2614128 RepID=UPI00029770C0|nr:MULTISPECIES: MATE family efflux transporter [unclassified Clostridium]EKQ55207.1 MAG: putative efflux protein, MATE family [Clostridium sp. Maddingley MBC34-26]